MPGRSRVAFITSAFGWGGTEKHLEELVTRLDPTRVEPVIVCLGPAVYRESLNARYGLDVPVIDAQGTEGFRGYWRVFRSVRPDVVVLDLDLPGREAFGILARLGGTDRVPIVALLPTGDDAAEPLAATLAEPSNAGRAVPLARMLDRLTTTRP